MAGELEFRVLGPLEAVRDGVAVRLGGAKQQTLLALLLLERGRAATTRRLSDGLWGRAAPPSAPKALQLYVSQLRKLLGARTIETRAEAYLLPLRAGALDLAEFERLADLARSNVAAGRPREAAALYDRALGLWRGEALEGLDEPGLAAARARLDELRLVVLELMADTRLAAGLQAELLPELALAAERSPLRERLHEQLMMALYRDGRQAEALAAFRRLRDALDSELGLEPQPRLRALEQAILRQDRRLEAPPVEAARRTIVAAGAAAARLAALLGPLVRDLAGELVLLEPVDRPEELAAAAARLEPLRSPAVRVAAFVSRRRGAELTRFAEAEGAELLVVEASPATLADSLSHDLRRGGSDLVFFVDGDGPLPGERASVLFGAAEEDWKALELGAALARAHGVPLRLVGVEHGGRDASALLARAALVVQRFAAIATESALFRPDDDGSLAAAVAGGVLLAAAGGAWPEQLSPSRARLAGLGVPLLLVDGGPRPGLLAPREALTRFSWSVGG